MERTWLFKESEANRPLRDDITEKLASELAARLGVPAARVDLAERFGAIGCLVEDLRWTQGEDQPGQVLLAGVVEGYDPHSQERQGHTVVNIHRALSGFGSPPNSATPQDFDGFAVFTGYLVLDALISNGDRHDRNWAVLVPPPGQDGPNVLCGSYDHASSFGFNLSDEERLRRLTDQSVMAWAQKGWARQFERTIGGTHQSLVELARSAVQLCDHAVRDHWLDAIQSLQREHLEELLRSAPAITDVTHRFTVEALMINRQRILDGL